MQGTVRGLVGGVVVALAVAALMFNPTAMAPADWRAIVIALAAIAFWAFAILPEDVTGLAFFAAAMVLAIAPAEVVFAGFHAAAVWLVFGGLVIGAAVAATGLDRAISARFRPLFQGSYVRCLIMTVSLAVALAFLVPSTMTRVILLVPIVSSLALDLGYARGSKGYVGLNLAAILASYFPAVMILPAAVPTVALVGAADAVYDARITYAALLWTHGPVLGVAKAALIVWVLARLFPAAGPTLPGDAAEPAADPRRPRLALLLAVALGLWATDAVHGVSPAWIALTLAVICVLPRIGVLEPKTLQAQVNFRPGFYVAAILGVGSVFASTGLGSDAVDALAASSWLDADRDLANQVILAAAALATGAVATMPGIAAILVPVAGDVAAATGLALEDVLRTFVLGYSTAFLPYQVPPMIVGLGLAGIGAGAAARATLALALLSVLLLWPLTLGWWWLLDRAF